MKSTFKQNQNTDSKLKQKLVTYLINQVYKFIFLSTAIKNIHTDKLIFTPILSRQFSHV